MRLLEIKGPGKLVFTRDLIGDVPPYAILSHTWGDAEDEVTFQDICLGVEKNKTGYEKIQFCADQAVKDDLRYIWVDTCCINKSNDAELSEAIRSMYKWYQESTKCYVYLSDVSTARAEGQETTCLVPEVAFRESRWFSRGWTLQELIAPPCVEFFSKEGHCLGSKQSLESRLHEITRIPLEALRGALSSFNDEQRMTWTSNRRTTRPEDMAYSLLGILGIHIPIMYGEGKEGAFDRLQQAVEQRRKKRHLDNISTSSERTMNATKRPKNSTNSAEDSTHSTSRVDAATREALISQLYFEKIDERLTLLKPAQGKTCRWIFEKPQYKCWRDRAQRGDHGGFLWIKGHPGTGKSTLMKVLFEEARSKGKGDPSCITISFFFLARGSIEEKSVLGLYRSLLHQLYDRAAMSDNIFEHMTNDGARSILNNGWTIQTLKQTLTQAICELGSQKLTVFVDALDECDQTEITELVLFFEDLCEQADEAQVELQICFSSRHYPAPSVVKGVELTLESEEGHSKDIEQFIKKRLRVGKTKQAEVLRSEILEKSSGIFLWVVLVLDMLGSAHTQNPSISSLRGHLKHIPKGLADLFEMILVRDGHDLEQLQICLKWILFAKKPLKPEQLYFAVRLGLDRESSTIWDQDDIDLEGVKTFVRSASKGLAEVTRKATEVQFIHESVRDFLLGKYQNQWSQSSEDFVGTSHEMLKQCCLAQVEGFSQEQESICDIYDEDLEAEGLRTILNSQFPFLSYALTNCFYHADVAQKNRIDQEAFLASFPLGKWIDYHNLFEKHKTRHYTKSVDYLYIFAEHNLPNLILSDTREACCLDVGNEPYWTPLFAGFSTSNPAAVVALINRLEKSKPDNKVLQRLCKEYVQKVDTCRYGRNIHFSKTKSVIAHVIRHYDETLLAIVYELTKPASRLRNEIYEHLLSATRLGSAEMVRTLLTYDLVVHFGVEEFDRAQELLWDTASPARPGPLVPQTPQHLKKIAKYRHALHLGIECGHEAVVRLLAQDLEMLDNSQEYFTSALLHSARYGKKGIAEFLLEKGAIPCHTTNSIDETAIFPALVLGHDEIVELFLDKVVDTKASDPTNKTLLHYAALYGTERTVRTLLDRGADPNHADSQNKTPLHMAVSRHGQEDKAHIIEILLEKGADPNHVNYRGQTALHIAASWYYYRMAHEIVKVLLDGGVNVNCKDEKNQTALHISVLNRLPETVKMMLERGADPNCTDDRDQTPLHLATRMSAEKKVKILLEGGADPQRRDNLNRTPASLAEKMGNRKTAAILNKWGHV